MMKKLITIATLLICIGCKQNYEKDLWIKNESQSADNPRFEMTEDLMRNYLLKGTNSGKVFNLLGKPKDIDTTELGIRHSLDLSYRKQSRFSYGPLLSGD